MLVKWIENPRRRAPAILHKHPRSEQTNKQPIQQTDKHTNNHTSKQTDTRRDKQNEIKTEIMFVLKTNIKTLKLTVELYNYKTISI